MKERMDFISIVTALVLVFFPGKGTCDSTCPNGITNITGVTSGELVYPISGTYGINETRCWRIEVPKPYLSLGVFYHNYEMEECSGCLCDSLSFGDRYASPDKILCGKYSPRYGQAVREARGPSRPDETERGENIYFYFRSDGTVQYKGFNISYIVGSNTGSRTSFLNASDDETFVFNTPKYGITNYPENFDWQWLLIVPEGRQVQLTVDAFELEQSNNCENDYLEVRETNEYGAILVKPSCGTNKPATMTSSKNIVWVHFRSDFNASSTFKGFKATFKAGQGRLSAINPLMLLFISTLLLTASKDSMF